VKTVVEYLSDNGIDDSRLLGKCYGESSPATTNSTSDGRQMNRRVEFINVDGMMISAYQDMEQVNGVYIDSKLISAIGKRHTTVSGISANVKAVRTEVMEGLTFSVQIGAFLYPPDLTHPMFSSIESGVQFERYDDEITRFTAGSFNTLDEVIEHRDAIQSNFSDAFIVGFYNGEKISLAECVKMLSNN